MGCKFLVKSMFLQLRSRCFFPEYTGQLPRPQTLKGDIAKRPGNRSERGILGSSSSKVSILENGFSPDEFIYVSIPLQAFVNATTFSFPEKN